MRSNRLSISRSGLVLVATFLGGAVACAPPPESIAPVTVSTVKYQRLGCTALTAQAAEMDDRLALLYTRQRSNQANDLFKSVFFLHPRATIIGPDLVPAIALAKGERHAVNSVLEARC